LKNDSNMKEQILIETVKALVAGSKGLLAMDESIGTCNKRFAALEIPPTEVYRRDWRELIATTPGLGKYISGAILCDETIHQHKKDGSLIINAIIDDGIIPGIKVDTGAKAMAGFPGEKVTEGLDGLRERLADYYKIGARFAKWRSVIAVDHGIPTRACIEANAHALARYAALCQEAGIVPIVEPEVLMEGNHDLKTCFDITEQVLLNVFDQLYLQKVMLEGILLKPNMVMPGLESPQQATIDEVADASVNCLLESVPEVVGGIAFLSGGQTGEMASAHLNAMHVRHQAKLPWPLTFSFGRAIQQPAMSIWNGVENNKHEAQQSLYHRVKCDDAARRGIYTPEMENTQYSE
jgi:fructose-bisphosphate aldolase, class I